MIALALAVLLDVWTLDLDWRAHVEIDHFEGERFFSVAVWRYQRPPLYRLEVNL